MPTRSSARSATRLLTANDLSQISDPLTSRCRVLHMPLPRSCDFDVLLNGVLRDIAKQWQCAPERLPKLPPASVDRLRKRFLETLVPRRLRVDVESALAKAATRREWLPPVEHHERTRIAGETSTYHAGCADRKVGGFPG